MTLARMYNDPGQALEDIKRRGLPDVIAAIWEGRAPRRFMTPLARPVQFFLERENLRGGRFYLPLLESDREIIYALDVSNGTYLVQYYADPEPTLADASLEQMVAWMLIELGLAGLDDLVREFASALSFQHTDALFEFLDGESELNAETAQRQFVTSLPGPARRCELTTRSSGPWSIVGRVWPRHSGGGRPLNSVVMPHEASHWTSIRLRRIVSKCSPLSKLACFRSNGLFTGAKKNEANLPHTSPSFQIPVT